MVESEEICSEPQIVREDEIPDHERTNTMRLSIYEGAISNTSLSMADNYMIPFGLHLGISEVGIGMLSSFNGLLSPIGQIFGSSLMEKRNRKHILNRWIGAQSIIWIVLIMLSIAFENSIIIQAISVLFFLFYVLYIIFGSIASPAWFSAMADVVPNELRGAYFGKRNFYTSLFGLAFVFLSSIMLDYFKSTSKIALGFIIIFIFSFIMRQISRILLKKHFIPNIVYEKKEHVNLSHFFKNLSKTNFGRFCLFVALLNMGQAIAGPFFTVYMLNELEFNYSTYAAIHLANSMTAIFIFPIAGRLTDRFGNMAILKFGAFIIPSLPIFWIFLTNPYLLMAIPQVLGGIGWTCFNFAASNFIIESIPSKQRGYYLAYYNFLIGISLFFGNIMGTTIFFLGDLFVSPYQSVFLLSGVFRFLVVLLFITKIKEIRELKKKAVKKAPVTKLQPTNVNRGLNLILGWGKLRKRKKLKRIKLEQE